MLMSEGPPVKRRRLLEPNCNGQPQQVNRPTAHAQLYARAEAEYISACGSRRAFPGRAEERERWYCAKVEVSERSGACEWAF